MVLTPLPLPPPLSGTKGGEGQKWSPPTPHKGDAKPVSSLLKSYRGQKPKVLKNRTSRVP